MTQPAQIPVENSKRHGRRKRVMGPGPSYYAQGDPMVWLTGGSLVLCLVMIVSLLGYVVYQGTSTFWPQPIVQAKTIDNQVVLGEVSRVNTFVPGDNAFAGLDEQQIAGIREQLEQENEGLASRRLYRTGNFEFTNTRFTWLSDYYIAEESLPEWAIIMERTEWGRFYGFPQGFAIDGNPVAETPEAVWKLYHEHHKPSRQRYYRRQNLERSGLGGINRQMEAERLRLAGAERRHAAGDISAEQLQKAHDRLAEREKELNAEYEVISQEIRALNAENTRFQITMATADGREKSVQLAEVIRAYPANQLGLGSKIAVYFDRWWEFIFHDPHEANMEGGVFPAIIGTVVMTLIMTIFVVPLGVLAALYLREYAKAGPLVSAVRIAINNLAGVPSIVFGVFGLGFFCYFVGGGIDWLFYPDRLPSPTYGTGGVLWASLTLALLTLPVVIVATEESLAAVPGSMRQGSYACGASKWQTILRIVLPRAMPGIMTGMILAMARGAGEVAPLMLVGAVKLAPELPFTLDNLSGSLGFIPTGPVHLERSFMHLGFHIYDLAFQSPDSEGARPMVFTTTMLLISIVVVLNISAMWLRSRLRRRFAGSLF